MTDPKTDAVKTGESNAGEGQKPEDVTISQGLGKLFEAEEELTDEQTDAMAEKARAAAKDSRAERDNKNAQIASGNDK
ncbi:hypothetical protein [Sodalis sp. C49]|uniref:hypothetical protein n=1 Tax=unclassified Sodalis (in: enterobacteria) TaxID=2636512 RepID=UPI003965CEA2